MDPTQIQAYLPPLRQQLALLTLALLAVLWIVNQVRIHRLREEHALLWFLGLGGAIFLVFCDPLLVALTRFSGASVPASTLLLAAVFFLFIIAIWLTSAVSRQKQEINRLTILLSILRARVDEVDERGGGEPSPPNMMPVEKR